ncbi:uncharacterized protein LOC112589294 [Harpegnathos saltator]|uniref:uncharacterized protein LOC112589294 n=1 Tax=Harpegnathos saltator TaxID=610380 RepID=UPI000DBED6F6|nr:uncharacterized protein LOC112589294 [Harpegnathos saltator]
MLIIFDIIRHLLKIKNGNALNFIIGLRRLQEDPTFFDKVLFTDESNFQNSGDLNRHNFYYYSDVNTFWVLHIDHQHQWKVNVWCGILDGQIIGPHFFEEDINLETRGLMWFQHDGAPPHRVNIVRDYLYQRYPEYWIGFNEYVQWPPNYLDLTPCNFFRWGFIKRIVFATESMNSIDMRNRITRTLATIPEEVLQRTIIALCDRF